MTAPTRLAVGWCHSCGTLQLKDEMSTKWVEWTETVEPVCVEDPGEPWGVGVWDKGEHDPGCPTVALARARTVDWTPTLAECTCGAGDDEVGDEGS